MSTKTVQFRPGFRTVTPYIVPAAEEMIAFVKQAFGAVETLRGGAAGQARSMPRCASAIPVWVLCRPAGGRTSGAENSFVDLVSVSAYPQDS